MKALKVNTMIRVANVKIFPFMTIVLSVYDKLQIYVFINKNASVLFVIVRTEARFQYMISAT